jgi:hypothetical protein
MDSLESLNLALQRLTDASLEHLSDLEGIVALDDAVIDPLGTEGPLSEEQSMRLDRIRRWMTSPWYFVEPEGVSIFKATDYLMGVRSSRDLVDALRLCRVAFSVAGPSEDGLKAMDALESALNACHASLRKRLCNWPRQDLDTTTSRLRRIVRLLVDRKLKEICDLPEFIPERITALPVVGSQEVEVASNESRSDQPEATSVAGAALTPIDEGGISDEKPGNSEPLLKRTHTACFSSVIWDGVKFVFTPAQSTVVKCLWKAMDDGTPVLADSLLLERSGSTADSLRTVFHSNGKTNPAWGKMIIKAGRHCRQLSPSKSESHT